MDDVRIGRLLRALRRPRGWTQTELAVRCAVSQQSISLTERGHGSRLAAATRRRIFGALDARWEPVVTWRGGELDRLLDEDHARLVGAVDRRLASLGWEIAVEVTYSEYGERGSIDVLGARRDRLAMVVVEVKSDLTVIDATVRRRGADVPPHGLVNEHRGPAPGPPRYWSAFASAASIAAARSPAVTPRGSLPFGQ
jgi:transcriptional regulator with XRE-family HTH domain